MVEYLVLDVEVEDGQEIERKSKSMVVLGKVGILDVLESMGWVRMASL